MSLSQAIATSLSGLRTTQAGLSLVSSNVANAGTAGYVRKTLSQVETLGGNFGIGVRADAVNRELDAYVQRQLRTETAGGGYATQRSQLYQRLQDLYGKPGTAGSLETTFNDFTASLQALSSSPDSYSARGGAVAAAQTLADQLNRMTSGIQSLRSDCEQSIGHAVSQANATLQQVAKLNAQINGSAQSDATTSALLDQRDAALDQLSELMDVRIVQSGGNQVSVFTGSGVQLVGAGVAATLAFNAQSAVTPQSQWSADGSGLGTITLTSNGGGGIDLLANGAIRSGQIAALVEMRDRVLPQAQVQLDAIASGMSRAMSDRTIASTAAQSGPASGFDLDLGGLLEGNAIDLVYTDQVSQTAHKLRIVRVDDAAALPLSSASGGDVETLGVDFSGGMSGVVAQLNAAFGSRGLQFSSPSGSMLRVLDDGPAHQIAVTALSAAITTTSLSGGAPAMPLFLDGTDPYSGAMRSAGDQATGFAGRIRMNPVLISDPSRLVAYASSTAAGDSTRPQFLYAQLTSAIRTFGSLGGAPTASPFTGTVASFIQQAIAQQGQSTQAAMNLADGQDIVLQGLKTRMSDTAGVNVDEEMTTLLDLQTAYAANARVLATVKDLYDTLMKL